MLRVSFVVGQGMDGIQKALGIVVIEGSLMFRTRGAQDPIISWSWPPRDTKDWKD
jgi:hypothetical protein